MSRLHRRIKAMEERKLDLSSSNFLRPAVKQIGNSLNEIKDHYRSRGDVSIVQSSSPPHLAAIRSILLEYLEDDSFLYKTNIATGLNIEHTDSMVVLMDSLALAMNIKISPRPSDVLCDILLAICGQPVIVLTVVDEDKDSRSVTKYNTSVARGVTQTILDFTDESLNIVHGVLNLQDMNNIETVKTSITTHAEDLALRVPESSLRTGPSKYDKIVTAFWAGVVQTTCVISKDGRVDTDYVRMLTKDQCIILLENISKKEVEVLSEPGTGATTLMLEVARRLSRLGKTLLVCRSQEEKSTLRSVYKPMYVPQDLRRIDVSRYKHVVDETGLLEWKSARSVWTFLGLDTLTSAVRLFEQQTEFQSKMVEVLFFLVSQRRLDSLTYQKLYHTKTHVYSLLPDADEGVADPQTKRVGNKEESDHITRIPELHKLLFPVLTARYRRRETAKADYSDDESNLGDGSRTFQEQYGQEGPRNPVTEDSLKLSSSLPQLTEELKTKMTLEDKATGEISKLRNKLSDLRKASETKDEEVRKNPTDLHVWKTKGDELVLEMAPITMTTDITNIVGENVTLAPLETPSAQSPLDVKNHSQVHLLREFQHGRLQKSKFRNLLGQAIIEDSSSLSDLEVRSGRLQRVFGLVYIFSQTDSPRSFPVSCPAMTLNSERVHSNLAVSGEELTNTKKSGRADHRPGQFKVYYGTCAAPITLPNTPRTPTVPLYWETNTRVLVNMKKRGQYYLLEMAVEEEDQLDRSWSVYEGGSGWTVQVAGCLSHVDSWCTRVWEKGRQVGGCLSTTPYPTPGTYTNIKLATVLDVGQGRLAFIDLNKEKILRKLDVTFRQPVYPVFGVQPSQSCCSITMRLYSEREIFFTDVKRKLIAKALYRKII